MSYTKQSPNPRSYSENSVIANQLVVLAIFGRDLKMAVLISLKETIS